MMHRGWLHFSFPGCSFLRFSCQLENRYVSRGSKFGGHSYVERKTKPDFVFQVEGTLERCLFIV